MQFHEPVREGNFLKRYKRFFADIRAGDETITAMVPNTGSLKTCLFENAPCVYTLSSNPARKLKATLQLLKTPTGWVGVNTGITNKLVYEAWSSGLIGDWKRFKVAKPEYKISKESRLDLVLAAGDENLMVESSAAKSRATGPKGVVSLPPPSADVRFIEIKNVSLAENGLAQFPDAVTERGQKHLRDLMTLHARGYGAEIVFVVQRQDCEAFAPAAAIDPEYARLLGAAVRAGVVARVLACEIDPKVGVRVSGRELPIKLD